MFTARSGRSCEPATRRWTARSLSQERVFCWQASRLLITLMLALSVVAPVAAWQATPTAETAVARSVAWLLTEQAGDGGFVGFSGSSDAGLTADAIVAMAAAEQLGVEVELAPALAFLTSGDVGLVYAQTGAGQAAKLALAAVAAGADPHDFAGVDLLSLAVAGPDETTGLFGTGVYDHALVMLAVAAAGDLLPPGAVDALLATQLEDGSWAFDGLQGSQIGDTNTTALVIMALISADHDGAEVAAAVAYLKAAQLPGGGFPYSPGNAAAADANSTALVIQALIAAGEDPAAPEWNDAAAALLSFQNEGGAFRYMDDPADENLYATVQAIPAAAGLTLPVVSASGPNASPVAG